MDELQLNGTDGLTLQSEIPQHIPLLSEIQKTPVTTDRLLDHNEDPAPRLCVGFGEV